MTAETTDTTDTTKSSSALDPPASPRAERSGGVSPVAARKRRKGPKPRHVPQRTCIVLRQVGDKRALVRLVRTPEGRVEVDPTGKRNGRGAYLTADRAVWERALGSNLLARALKAEIVPDDLAALHAHAATLPSDPAVAAELKPGRSSRAPAPTAETPSHT